MTEFEQAYIATREKEGRVLSNDEVMKLPLVNSPEWRKRKKSANRFLHYLISNNIKKVTEIGCGNGWFCNYISKIGVETIGIDINQTELEQARTCFPQISFQNLDIMTSLPEDTSSQVVVLNASLQYFPSASDLFQRLEELYGNKIEVHVMDTPLYKPAEVEKAKERTLEYYNSLDSNMGEHYFHHTEQSLGRVQKLYKPSRLLNKIYNDSPFPWVKIL